MSVNPQADRPTSTRPPSVRDRAAGAIDEARDKTSDGIDQAPLIALVGGIALGALVAALLPRTKREDELLGGVGGRITGTARDAAEAARDAGKAKLDELGLTRDAGVETLRTILKGAGDAARTSAQAAVGTVRDKK